MMTRAVNGLTSLQDNFLHCVDLTDPSRLRCLLRKSMEIFDDFLFNGSLLREREGSLVRLLVDPLDRGALGLTTTRMIHGLKLTEISIAPIVTAPDMSNEGKKRVLSRYLGTLCHEMVHAYFDTFCWSWTRSEMNCLGGTGHGICWQQVAGNIEDFWHNFIPQGLGIDMCLGRLEAWMHELEHFTPEDTPDFQRKYSEEINSELQRVYG